MIFGQAAADSKVLARTRWYGFTVPRSLRAPVLPFLAWLLASFATAAFAHGLIGLSGAVDPGGRAYDAHAHAALAPVALAALSLVTIALLGSALRALSRSERIDPVVVLARRFGRMHPVAPALAVALGGFATLLGMEFTEQLSAFGAIRGVRDALGGNALIGCVIVVLVATLVTIIGLRSARALLATVTATLGALVAWIVATTPAPIDRAGIARRIQHRRHASTSAFLARCSGLRAPPADLI